MSYKFIASDTSVGGDVILTDVFSADYDVYFGTLTGTNAIQNSNIKLRLVDTTDTVIATNNYGATGLQMKSYASPADQLKYTTETSFFTYLYSRQTFGGMYFYIHQPYESDSWTYFSSHASGNYANDLIVTKMAGRYNVQETITGISTVSDANHNLTLSIWGVS